MRVYEKDLCLEKLIGSTLQSERYEANVMLMVVLFSLNIIVSIIIISMIIDPNEASNGIFRTASPRTKKVAKRI